MPFRWYGNVIMSIVNGHTFYICWIQIHTHTHNLSVNRGINFIDTEMEHIQLAAEQ